jgi:hypothetical protein
MTFFRWATAALLVLPLAAGACGGPQSRPAASASPSSVGADQILAIGRRFAACVRAHGIPGFPDPVLNGGYLELPSGGHPDQGKAALKANEAARDACEPILAELPPSATRPRKPSGQEDMQALLKFAQCMRRHGLPTWPDPDANGDFPLQQAGIQGKTPAVITAMQACKSAGSGPIGVK